MSTQTTTANAAAPVGGAPGQTLTTCNRCGGSGIWRSRTGSAQGQCFACHGAGLLDEWRARRYLARFTPRPKAEAPAPAASFEGLLEEAHKMAREAHTKALTAGWVMIDPVQTQKGAALLGRDPKRPGRSLLTVWDAESLTITKQWLEGPPSKHKHLLGSGA